MTHVPDQTFCCLTVERVGYSYHICARATSTDIKTIILDGAALV